MLHGPSQVQLPEPEGRECVPELTHGLLEEKAGRLSAAAEVYLGLLLMESKPQSALLGLGRVYLAMSDWESAGLFLEALLMKDPGHIDGRLMLGLVRYQQGDYGAAIRLLSRPDDPCVLGRESRPLRECLGECHYQQGDFERAILTWLPLLEHPPVPERILSAIGAAFFHLGRYQSAYAFFQEALEQNPTNAGALNNCGVVCFHLGDTEGAERWLEAALTQDPGLKEARDNLNYLAGTRPGSNP